MTSHSFTEMRQLPVFGLDGVDLLCPRIGGCPGGRNWVSSYREQIEQSHAVLVVSVLTSLDGYYEGPGKDLAPMPFEDAFNTHNLSLLKRAGTLVYGSTWFQNNWEHWSAVAADESQTDRDREIAELVTSLDAVVISDSMRVAPDAPWAATTRVVPCAEGPTEVARLKQGDGDDLLMFGSATTWNPLLERRLVDELIVLVGAALVGDGSKLYSGSPVGLRLLEARVLPDSQLVELRYEASVVRG